MTVNACLRNLLSNARCHCVGVVVGVSLSPRQQGRRNRLGVATAREHTIMRSCDMLMISECSVGG